MPKMTGKQGLKLQHSIENNISKEWGDKYALYLPLSQSSDYIKKFKWATDSCTYLEENFTPEEIVKIRLDCSCEQSENTLNDIKKLYSNSSDINDFCDRYNEKYEGHETWYDGENFYFSYHTCYCSAVKRVKENISKTWCLCSLGYVKKRFDYVFDRDLKVELLESIKTGGKRCLFKINI